MVGKKQVGEAWGVQKGTVKRRSRKREGHPNGFTLWRSKVGKTVSMFGQSQNKKSFHKCESMEAGGPPKSNHRRKNHRSIKKRLFERIEGVDDMLVGGNIFDENTDASDS